MFELDLVRWPEVTEDDLKLVQETLQAGDIYAGRQVIELEEEWSDFVGQTSVAVSSCTAAIHLALLALNIGPGDGVLVPAYTFSGTTHPVLHVGAIPIFVDVDLDGIIDVDRARQQCIAHGNVKAMIVVHMHGLAAEMIQIDKLCTDHHLLLIEDACQAPGIEFHGKMLGTFGEAGCWSFSSSKPITGGQGGMVTTESEHVLQRIKSLRQYGERIETLDIGAGLLYARDFTSYVPGYNYGMSGLNAALVRSMLPRLKGYNQRANANAKKLWEALHDEAFLEPPIYYEQHSFHKFRVRVHMNPIAPTRPGPDNFKLEMMRRLHAAGVPISIWGCNPVPHYPVYGGRINEFPEASRQHHERFMLFNETYPLCVQTEETIDQVISLIKQVLRGVEKDFQV